MSRLDAALADIDKCIGGGISASDAQRIRKHIETQNNRIIRLQEIVDKAHDLAQLVIAGNWFNMAHEMELLAQNVLNRIGELKR